MHVISSKTLEFEFPLEIPERWFELLSQVWNQGLFKLKHYEHQERIKKCRERGIDINPEVRIELTKDENEKWTFYQPTEIKRRIDKTKSFDADNIEIVPVDYGIGRGDEPPPGFAKPRYVHPLWVEPSDITKDTEVELRKPFAKSRCDWLNVDDFPITYSNDFIGLVLVAAWNAYKKGQRKCPKYKKPEDRVNTIPSASFRGCCDWLGNDTIKLMGFEPITIPGIDQLVFEPMKILAQEIQNNPKGYPQCLDKLHSIRLKERARLIKSEGLSLSELRQQLEPDELDNLLAKYDAQIDDRLVLEKAVEYFSYPGSYRLIHRQSKNYLQISGFFLTTPSVSTKTVAIDSGVNLLIDGTNNLKVDHGDFSQLKSRLINLDRRISLCVVGSNQHKKLLAKKRAIESKVARQRRTRQAFFAAQIADVNGTIIYKHIEIPETVGLPLPKPDGKGGYLPNGATAISKKNDQIFDCSLGQFRVLLEQQSKKYGRQLEIVKVDPKTTATEMLSADSVRARSGRKTSPSNPPREGEMVERKLKEGGKRKRLPKSPQTPEPIKFKKRDRHAERQIG